MHKQCCVADSWTETCDEALCSAATVSVSSGGVKGQHLTSASLFIWPFILCWVIYELQTGGWLPGRTRGEGASQRQRGGQRWWREEVEEVEEEDGEKRRKGQAVEKRGIKVMVSMMSEKCHINIWVCLIEFIEHLTNLDELFFSKFLHFFTC